MSMSRQYQHLKMLQRSGVFKFDIWKDGHTPKQLALECPACPHPGRNLPDDWKDRKELSVTVLLPN